MFDSLQNIHFPEIREFFSQMAASGQVRDAVVPIGYLLDLLQADEFESGSHVLMPDKDAENH